MSVVSADPSMVSCSDDGIWVLVMEVPRRFPAVIHMLDPVVYALEVPRRFSGSDPIAGFWLEFGGAEAFSGSDPN